MELVKGVSFRTKNENNEDEYWRITDIYQIFSEKTYVLEPILESLDKYKKGLEKIKQDNPFLEDLQNLSLEEYAKLDVGKRWFSEHEIFRLESDSYYIVFDKGGWETLPVCLVDKDCLSSFLWEIQKTRSYTDDDMDKYIVVKEQPINSWIYAEKI